VADLQDVRFRKCNGVQLLFTCPMARFRVAEGIDPDNTRSTNKND